MVFRHQHVRYFRIAVDTQYASDNGADAGAGNDLRQQSFFPECLNNAEMEHAQRGTAAEQQGRAAVTGQGIAEELQLLGHWESRYLGVT